jgi:hypothetical protein
MRRSILLFPLLMLAACGDRGNDNKDGTSFTLDGKGEDGEDVAINADGKSGDVEIKVPGFEGKVSLPKININSTNFDIDGVKLYPGSSVSGMHVSADSGRDKHKEDVTFNFTSPADPAKVAAYLREAFAEKKVVLAGGDAALSGTQADGDRFIIKLAPAAAGQTSGTISIGGK